MTGVGCALAAPVTRTSWVKSGSTTDGLRRLIAPDMQGPPRRLLPVLKPPHQ